MKSKILPQLPTWTPSPQSIAKSNMTLFTQWLEEKNKKKFHSYDELYQFTIQHPEIFWQHFSEWMGIKWHSPYEQVLIRDHQNFKNSKWFTGGKINFAEHLIPPPSQEIIILSYAEGRPVKKITAEDFVKGINAYQKILKSSHVKINDRVAGVLPNIPEAIMAMLATTSLGAIWSSCSPDFGTQGIIDRFSQIEPTVIFYVKRYFYHQKECNIEQTISECKKLLPSVKEWIDIDELSPSENPEASLEFTPTPFDHPVYILYSSGTTGKPKCIIHGAGGTLLQHFKELSLHSNLQKNDQLCFYTTCGWMMWNWMVSALGIGGKLFLFDGSPAQKDDPLFFWKMMDEYHVEKVGTSPKYISSCMKSGLQPNEKYHFNSLQTILSTGSPLLPEHYDWVYNFIKKDVHLASISGGTDIVSCFMLGQPNAPVYSGEIQCLGLGMPVEAWDENETPVKNQKGELVATGPFPSMPIYFWNDPDGKKYDDAYFNFYAPRKNVWRHGDFIEITDRGGIIVYGRSDATLNPGGIRIGTSEIYRALELIPGIEDTIAVSMHEHDDDVILLFIKVKQVLTSVIPNEHKGMITTPVIPNEHKGMITTPVIPNDSRSEECLGIFSNLIQMIKQTIRQKLSPRHVPKYIFKVDDIPYTRSGKKVESTLQKIFANEKINNVEAIANPQCLEEYQKIYQENFLCQKS